MKKLLVSLFIFALLKSNPILVDVINEFQTAPTDSERVEFRYLHSPSTDTIILTDSINLFGTMLVIPDIYSPGNSCSSYIDTEIYISAQEYITIDRSFLSGQFYLPNDSGYIKVYYYYNNMWIDWGSIYYPGNANANPIHSPAPPIYCSAAKFYRWAYDPDWPLSPYFTVKDWYIDYTPTFGMPNDDYPGCFISGYVYDGNGSPISGAQIIAKEYFYGTSAYIVNPSPYYSCCTTYTANDGFYTIDSLLPIKYSVAASADGYLPENLITQQLCCTDPVTNLNFYLQTGVYENHWAGLSRVFYVYPNPFFDILYVVLLKPVHSIDIFDVTGELCVRIDNPLPYHYIKVDCNDLPKGVYFIKAGQDRAKVVKD